MGKKYCVCLQRPVGHFCRVPFYNTRGYTLVLWCCKIQWRRGLLYVYVIMCTLIHLAYSVHCCNFCRGEETGIQGQKSLAFQERQGDAILLRLKKFFPGLKMKYRYHLWHQQTNCNPWCPRWPVCELLLWHVWKPKLGLPKTILKSIHRPITYKNITCTKFCLLYSYVQSYLQNMICRL
jgi:hypothetical protein